MSHIVATWLQFSTEKYVYCQVQLNFDEFLTSRRHIFFLVAGRYSCPLAFDFESFALPAPLGRGTHTAGTATRTASALT